MASAPSSRREAADQDGVGHGRQLAQRLVAVLARAEVGLGERVDADQLLGVEQHRDLHAVADREGEPLEQLAARGHLAGEGLGEAGQRRAVKVEQRARHELGHAAALARADLAAGREAAAGRRP